MMLIPADEATSSSRSGGASRGGNNEDPLPGSFIVLKQSCIWNLHTVKNRAITEAESF